MSEKPSPHSDDTHHQGIIAAGEAGSLETSFTRGAIAHQGIEGLQREPTLREKISVRRQQRRIRADEALAASLRQEQAQEMNQEPVVIEEIRQRGGLLRRAREVAKSSLAKANEYALRLQAAIASSPETKERSWPKKAAALGVGALAVGSAYLAIKGVNVSIGGSAQPIHDMIGATPTPGGGAIEHLPKPPIHHIPAPEMPHLHTETLGHDDTVWAHAKANLPEGASNQAVYNESVKIMKASHIPVNPTGADPLEAARHLQPGTELTVPDDVEKR